MGTSKSFSGSGGPDARNLRGQIAGWLDDYQGSSAATSQLSLAPVVRMLTYSRRGKADGPGGGGGQRGGAQRSLDRIAEGAARAASLAISFQVGDREALREAGLDYDSLRTASPLVICMRIVQAALGTEPDGTIAEDERSEITARVAAWLLEFPGTSLPSLEAIVRKCISQAIYQVAITELASTIFASATSQAAVLAAEARVLELADALADTATLPQLGPTPRLIARAIEDGVRTLVAIEGAGRDELSA